MSQPTVRVSTDDDSTVNDAVLSEKIPRVPWDNFVRRVFQPKPGEHVAVIGPTGQGKTVLINNIVPMYPFVAIFATKPLDNSLDTLTIHRDYRVFNKWIPLPAYDVPRRIIWPDASKVDAYETQEKVFRHAIESIFREGGRPKSKPVGWALAVDELWYITNVLQLKNYVRMILLQGRSLGISLIAATQRPAFVPLEVYDQSTHLFFFQDNDKRNLDRLSGLNVRESGLLRKTISGLEEHQVLYLNTRNGTMARTRAPKPVEQDNDA